VTKFTYLGSLQSSHSNSGLEYIRHIGLAASAMKRFNCVWSQRNLSTPTKIRMYSTCIQPVLLYVCETWTLSETDWTRLDIWTPFMCAVSSTSHASIGMTSSPMMKSFAVLAYLKFRSLFANEDSVFSATLQDSYSPYQPISFFEYALRRDMASGHRRHGDVRVVGHPPPGFAATRVS